MSQCGAANLAGVVTQGLVHELVGSRQLVDDEAFGQKRFQLVEIMIPRGVMSDTLSRFVAAVRRISGPGSEVSDDQ